MDDKSNEAVALSEIYYKNDTKSNSSVFCSNNASKSLTLSSRTNDVTECRVESSSKLTVKGSDELRDEMINALAWAICRAFKYQPSDPIHYIAYQLLRWRYGDVTKIIAPETTKFINKYDCDGCNNSSSSFCSDQCEDTCNEQSSDNETSTSR